MHVPLVAFVAVERRAAELVLAVRLFRHRIPAVANAAILLLGASATKSGVILMPLNFARGAGGRGIRDGARDAARDGAFTPRRRGDRRLDPELLLRSPATAHRYAPAVVEGVRVSLSNALH